MPSSVTWGLLLLAGLCCLAPAALAEDAAQDTDAAEHAEAAASHKIAPNLADFAFSLYRQVARQSNTTNIFFSPVSIATAFAMLSLGAKGTTRTQLLEGLHLDLQEVPEAAIYTELLSFLHNVKEPDNETCLITGNILFANLSVKFKDEFLKYVWELRHSDVFCLRFRDAKARTMVNNFIEMKIREKELDLFEEFDKDTTLVLVDYIVFKGMCYHQPSLVPMETSKTILKHQFLSFPGRCRVSRDCASGQGSRSPHTTTEKHPHQGWRHNMQCAPPLLPTLHTHTTQSQTHTR